MNLWLANPRGFCAGVERAVRMVEELLDVTEAPVYVRHEIVHNRSVVDGLRSRGAVFVEATEQIPERRVGRHQRPRRPPQVHREVAHGARSSTPPARW